VAPEGDLVENRLDGFSVPTELARDPLEPGTVWVADTGAGHLWRIPASALTRADLPPPIQGGLEAPLSFAIDPGSGEIWVGDVGSDRIVRLARDGTVVRSLGFGSPLRVEVWWR
jgi:streptogramin lyase